MKTCASSLRKPARGRGRGAGGNGAGGLRGRGADRLSAGQQRRVALTRLADFGDAVDLDEPFTALDATAVERLTRRLEQHVQAGGSVILTTHQPLRALACPLRTLRLSGERTVGW